MTRAKVMLENDEYFLFGDRREYYNDVYSLKGKLCKIELKPDDACSVNGTKIRTNRRMPMRRYVPYYVNGVAFYE